MLQYPTGGHSDTAAGAKLTIITAPLLRDRKPVVVDDVAVISTPGEILDVLVTDHGIAVNPHRQDLIDRLKDQQVPFKINIQSQVKIDNGLTVIATNQLPN